jgi:hypothetical protein
MIGDATTRKRNAATAPSQRFMATRVFGKVVLLLPNEMRLRMLRLPQLAVDLRKPETVFA